MLFYARATSERASKGQGGNEHVEVDVTAGGKQGQSIVTLRLESMRTLQGGEMKNSGLYVLTLGVLGRKPLVLTIKAK